MSETPIQLDQQQFIENLYQKLAQVCPGIQELEPYEFRYALDNLTPPAGWGSIEIKPAAELEWLIAQREFYQGVQIKPMRSGQIVLDETVLWLTHTLLAGLARREYSPEWVRRLFYFDLRGFFFLVRTEYFTPAIRERFGGGPALQFEPAQAPLEPLFEVGYREFKAANQAVDRAFLDTVQQIIAAKTPPLLLSLVGPTAAGKTEITVRLRAELEQAGKSVATLEMDHFLKDREYRGSLPMDKEVIHFEIFKRCLADLLARRAALSPRYDFILATSSHDLDGNLRPGQSPILIQPADIILLEGNFPFHIPEVAPLIDLKVVYLTDDPLRLKRKWKRDIDCRKKYDPLYLCNRFFRTQFLRAEEVYRPMMAVCDIVVDTTAAALWLTPEIRAWLDGQPSSPHTRSMA